MKKIKAILIGKDGFKKEIFIQYPMPQIFIPKIEPINVYTEDTKIYSKPIESRIFVLKNEYKNKLEYQEN